MANLLHIAETAVLLFIAYQAAWFVAFGARRLLSRSGRAGAVPATRIAMAKGEAAEPAATGAVIASEPPAPTTAVLPSASSTSQAAEIPAPPRPRPAFVPVAPAPTPPPTIPTLAETSPEASFLSVLEAHDDEEPAALPPKTPDGPAGTEAAIAAIRDAIGRSTPEPKQLDLAPEPEPVSEPEPVVTVEPAGAVAPPPAPSATPPHFDTAPREVASAPAPMIAADMEDDIIAVDASLETQLAPAAEDAFPVTPEPIIPVAAEDVEFVFQVDPRRSEDVETGEADAAPEPPPPPRQLKPASRPGEAWSGRPVPPSPAILTSVVEAALDPIPPAATPPSPPAVSNTNAEADAMRAIEGGWTRRPSTRPAEAASRAGAGPAARAAPTRPPALLEPREGGKDDLGLIEGLRPADEAALNALGIFHFDQIAAWNRAAVEWLELHQIGAGRVTGEKWVEQAQMLSSIASSARAIGG